jgi:predicted CoA-substrate-specific enzyme activase
MYTLGIDIGSTTSKCLILEDGEKITASVLIRGGVGTTAIFEITEKVFAESGLAMKDMAAVVSTGYGRGCCQDADIKASELTCHALGAYFTFPEVHTVIDIGGQDAKVITLDKKGAMKNFLMNDKCAAGTGRFLEVIAGVIRIPVEELESLAGCSKTPAAISSTCTVFAESEVISQLANGVNTADIAAGICVSVASRVAALVKRLGIVPAVCMSGGVALNSGVRKAMENALGEKILFSAQAQLFGALGAAVHAFRLKNADRQK